MTRTCVIGDPIKHSRSPLIHGYWLKTLGIAGTYTREHVRPEDLPEFFLRLRNGEFAGCNVTLPHKEAACLLVDEKDSRVERTGSLNTVYVRNGRLHATSTDGEGFATNVLWRVPDFKFTKANIMILGAGGSARALIDDMLQRGVASITIANRTVEKASLIASQFGPKVCACSLAAAPLQLPTMSLLLNTTSAGVANGEALNLDIRNLPASAVVSDINYVPLVTPFLRAAAESGHRIVPGLGMLLFQAVRGFELWHDCLPEVTEELYDIVAQDINSATCP
jgi:shikimate dehydrogenase